MKMNKVIVLLLAFSYSLLTTPCFAQANTTGEPDLSYYEIINNRNFFKPQKDLEEKEKPEIDKKTAEQKSSTKSTDLILTGTVKIRNKYKAIIEKISTKEGYYVTIGDSIDQFTLAEVKNNSVLLKKNDQTFELYLKEVKNGKEELTKPNNLQKQKLKDNKPASQPTLNYQQNMMQRLRTGKGGIK